jgi:pimeloyl-ACP methyl ester carboxylesterase
VNQRTVNREPRTENPLVLIPGIQGRWEYMQPTVEALSAHFDVITFSLRGKRLEDYVDQIRGALDERRLERAVICGVSFGGVVALRFAAEHSARTRALVLASTPGPTWRLSARHDMYARWPLIFGPLFLVETPRRLQAEMAIAFPSRRERWAFRRRVLRTLLSAPISFRTMAARARLIERRNALNDCACVTAPTLIVTGDSHLDHVVPVGGSSEYARLIAGACSVTIDRTGHLGSITRPGEFARVVAQFVASNAGGDPRVGRRPAQDKANSGGTVGPDRTQGSAPTRDQVA